MKLQFTVSAGEVLRFKQSAILHSKEHYNKVIQEENDDCFTQFGEDNLDHHIVTLTGKGTFHEMGKRWRQLAIKQVKNRQPTTSFEKEYRIPINSYHSSGSKCHSMLKLKPIIELESLYALPTEWNYDFLSHATRFVKTSTEFSKNWSGFMQDITSRSVANNKAVIRFLFIHLFYAYHQDIY